MDGAVSRSRENGTIATIPASSSVSSFSSSSSDSPPKVNYIEHRVSKMDTLPGVAIKYGVEVIGIEFLALFGHSPLLFWFRFFIWGISNLVTFENI